MYTKQEIIIRSYREGKSQRAISRELQISRKTVRKYIEEYEHLLYSSKSKEKASSEYLSDPPVYKSNNRHKLKLTREVQSSIDKLLDENQQKKRQGLGKQMLKKCDILEQLHKQGFDIGYTTVCNYIRGKSLSPQSKEAFIRQEYKPGEVCEFDWGEIKLLINDKQVRLQLAVFTSAYGNYRFADLYQRQDTLSFMEAHVSFFEHTKGVYRQMVYDNMRVAISKFIGKEKEPTRALLRLRGHYQFTHRFCNFYRGNEKGHVERSVEFIRRKAFGPKSDFKSIEEARLCLKETVERLNMQKQTLTGQTAKELFHDEQKLMPPAPSRLICNEQFQLRVDKYSTISFKTNRYSVPDHLVGHFLDIKATSHEIEVFSNGSKVARHKRCYGKHQWIISIEHYLETFKHKPGALPGSLALSSKKCLKRLYLEYFNNAPRDFIDLLEFCQKEQIQECQLEEAISKIKSPGTGKVTVEKLKAVLGNKPKYTNRGSNDETSQYSKKQLLKLSALIN